jgi:hypothetical protein
LKCPKIELDKNINGIIQKMIAVNSHPYIKHIIIADIIIEKSEIKYGIQSEIPYLNELFNLKN